MVKILPFSLYDFFAYAINMMRTEVVKIDTEALRPFRNCTLHKQNNPLKWNQPRGVKAKINSAYAQQAICYRIIESSKNGLGLKGP